MKKNQNLINLLEDLEVKLGKIKYQCHGEDNFNKEENYKGYNIKETMNINSNSFKEYPYSINNQNNYDKISHNMEFNIRNIIKDEFNSLILAYQQEMHNGFNIMQSKIEKNSIEIKGLKEQNVNKFQNLISGESGIIFNQPMDNNQYILRVEYDNKITELEHQITTLNTCYETLKGVPGGKIGDYQGKDEHLQKINEIQSQFEDILDKINKYQNNINSINQSLAEVKINSNKIKNDLSNEIYNIKNEFAGNIQKINNNINKIQNNQNNINGNIEKINSDLNNLRNEFDIFTKQLDMNFMSSLKTIVNQHVTIAEFNVVKNMISGYDNQIKDIMNKNNNYDITINNIQDNIKRMKNETNNKNINQSGIDEPKSSNSKENDSVNLNENQLKLLNELKKNIDQINTEISIIKNNNYNENIAILKTRINEIDTEIGKLKGKIDLDKSITDLKNKVIEMSKRVDILEKQIIKESTGIFNEHKTKLKESTIDKVEMLNPKSNYNLNDINKEVIESNNNYNLYNIIENSNSNNNLENDINILHNNQIKNKKKDVSDDEYEEQENVEKQKSSNILENNIKQEDDKKEKGSDENKKKDNSKKNSKGGSEDFEIGSLDDLLSN